MSRKRIVSQDLADFELWQQSGESSGRIPRRLVDRIISDELSEHQRLYLTDYYFGQMNIYEIANKYSVAPSTVSRTLKRARMRISAALKYLIRR